MLCSWRIWHWSVQESRSKNFKGLSHGSRHEGTVSNLRSKEQCEVSMCHNIRQQQWDHFRTRSLLFWTSKYAKKTHPPRASHISDGKDCWDASRNIYKTSLSSVATLMKYFGGILSIVILNIVTGPGASVAGSSKSFQPGDRRNLCSPAKHLHTHILTFAGQRFIVDDRD